jgi:hypothetical protein
MISTKTAERLQFTGVVVLLTALLAIVIVLVCFKVTPHVVAKVGATNPKNYLTEEGRAEQERSLFWWPRKKRLFMTYYDKTRVPEHVWELFKEHASEYNVTVHDDKEIREWMKLWYVPKVIKQFDLLSGPHRADLTRFCWLYVQGGVYLDIKTVPLAHLDSIFDERVVAVDSNMSKGHIGILNGPPASILHGRMIDIIVRTPPSLPKSNYLTFVNSFFDYSLPEAQALGTNVQMFHEFCDCNIFPEIPKDKYGLCCAILNDSGTVVMHGRDSAYPY